MNATTQFATPETETVTEEVQRGQSVSTVTGSVFNDSPYGFKRVVATAVITGPNGNVAGVNQVTLTNVGRFSDNLLHFGWQRRFEFGSTAAVFVETDVWDEANLIAPQD